MPHRPMRICSQPGCGKLTHTGRCEDHPKKAWADRGSRHERGYGSAWDKLRLCILRRDSYLCQDQCKRDGRVTPANEVDHITPKAQGGTDDENNLQSICTTCHREKTAREKGR